MSDATAQEPTMEEILASIRRIISEDDAPAAAEAEPAEEPIAAAMPPGQAVADEPEPAIEEDDDVLELTEAVSPPQPEPALGGHVPPPEFAAAASQVMGDLDISFPPGPTAAPPKAAPPPIYTPPAQAAAAASYAASSDEGLLSAPTLDRAASMFGALGRTVIMPAEGRTLEDLVSELLRPMLKDWLDQHLPSIVEAKVQAEVERVSRHR